MKYYTLNEAVQKAYKERKTFKRDPVQGFYRGLYNGARMFFGYASKEYYFEKDKKDFIKLDLMEWYKWNKQKKIKREWYL